MEKGITAGIMRGQGDHFHVDYTSASLPRTQRGCNVFGVKAQGSARDSGANVG